MLAFGGNFVHLLNEWFYVKVFRCDTIYTDAHKCYITELWQLFILLADYIKRISIFPFICDFSFQVTELQKSGILFGPLTGEFLQTAEESPQVRQNFIFLVNFLEETQSKTEKEAKFCLASSLPVYQLRTLYKK